MTDGQRVLDDICRGAADDVYMAHQARRLLEEIDTIVAVISDFGVGKGFFAGLQGILQRELVLGLTRVYEPYSPRNPGHTPRAAAHLIATHAANLPRVDSTSGRPLDQALAQLKALRDKAIAHHDRVDQGHEGTEWSRGDKSR